MPTLKLSKNFAISPEHGLQGMQLANLAKFKFLPST